MQFNAAVRRLQLRVIVTAAFLLLCCVHSFVLERRVDLFTSRKYYQWNKRIPKTFVPKTSLRNSQGEDEEDRSTLTIEDSSDLDPSDITESAKQFTVLTCTSTSCAERRKRLGLDEYSTFSAFWTRAKEGGEHVTVEESPCLGSCRQAPCVAVLHDDYEGPVALEGMTDAEFEQRVFHDVVDEADANRVWDSVENAIQVMVEREDDDDE